MTRSTLLCAGLVVAALVSTRWVRVNVSPSVPLGVYLLERRAPLALSRGTLVLLPVPTAVRPWIRTPLLKPVAALAGDSVCIAEHHLFVRGSWYGEVLARAQGKDLPTWLDGCTTVPEGHVFLAVPMSHSLDGRYFGMTPTADLTAAAIPLWTWR